MEYSTHGNGNGLNDLYLAFEPTEWNEIAAVKHFLKSKGYRFGYFVGDGDFKGKICIKISFGECLKSEIKQLIERG